MRINCVLADVTKSQLLLVMRQKVSLEPPAIDGTMYVALPPIPVGGAISTIPRYVFVLLAKLTRPVVDPATPTDMPPLPWTASVLLIVVAPFNDTAPVPVANVPVPVCKKLPLVVIPPLAVNNPVNVEMPVTAKVPPNEVAPVPTLKVFAPVTLAEPFKLTAPVPVLNVPVPL